MNKSDLEKAKLGSESIADFIRQFESESGTLDIYTNIVLEELFKEIYGQPKEKTLPIPGKTGQEGVEGN